MAECTVQRLSKAAWVVLQWRVSMCSRRMVKVEDVKRDIVMIHRPPHTHHEHVHIHTHTTHTYVHTHMHTHSHTHHEHLILVAPLH